MSPQVTVFMHLGKFPPKRQKQQLRRIFESAHLQKKIIAKNIMKQKSILYAQCPLVDFRFGIKLETHFFRLHF